MSDLAVAREIGERLEQLRLEKNLTQQQLADEIGITAVSYRNLIDGKGKFKNLIALMRALGKVEQFELLLPPSEFSPMERLKMRGKRRQRAGHKRKQLESPSPSQDSESLDW